MPNLRVYENIGVPPPPTPRIDTAIGEHTTGRVPLCTFSIQQCVHMPSFLILETEFQTYLNVIQPLYNIIMTYYTACLQHDIQC